MHDRSLSLPELVGTWRLQSWDSVFDDGRRGLIAGGFDAEDQVFARVQMKLLVKRCHKPC